MSTTTCLASACRVCRVGIPGFGPGGFLRYRTTGSPAGSHIRPRVVDEDDGSTVGVGTVEWRGEWGGTKNAHFAHFELLLRISGSFVCRAENLKKVQYVCF